MVRTSADQPELDPGTPVGINVAVAAVVITAGTFVAAALPATDLPGRCAVVALVLAGFAAVTADLRASALAVVPTWMLMNGFLVDHTGDLAWHGADDVNRLLVLAGAGLLGWGLGAGRRSLLRARDGWRLDLAAAQLADEYRTTSTSAVPLVDAHPSV